MPVNRLEPSSAMRVWCTMLSEEPTKKSISSKCITSRNSSQHRAARARATLSRPPCRPTNQCSSDHSNISTLGRWCVIIRSIRKASNPLPVPPANGRGHYPTPVRTRWQASLSELTWIAPTPSQAIPSAGRKEGKGNSQPPSHRNTIRTTGSRSHSLCVASTLHQLVVGHFGSSQYGRYVSDDYRST